MPLPASGNYRLFLSGPMPFGLDVRVMPPPDNRLRVLGTDIYFAWSAAQDAWVLTESTGITCDNEGGWSGVLQGASLSGTCTAL